MTLNISNSCPSVVYIQQNFGEWVATSYCSLFGQPLHLQRGLQIQTSVLNKGGKQCSDECHRIPPLWSNIISLKLPHSSIIPSYKLHGSCTPLPRYPHWQEPGLLCCNEKHWQDVWKEEKTEKPPFFFLTIADMWASTIHTGFRLSENDRLHAKV